MIFVIKNNRNKRICFEKKFAAGIMLCFLIFFFKSQLAAAGYDIYSNPNVYWAPDHMAFTTDRGEKDYVAYPYGQILTVGERKNRVPKDGEHIYLPQETDDISVSQWRVAYTPGLCIHRNSVTEYHGIPFYKEICSKAYKCGWFATCADCGEEIRMYFYMDLETALTITKLPAGKDYYYGCPHCGHMEMGAKISHVCNRVSSNKYRISYRKNARDAKGYMDDSTFYYNNTAEYEGHRVYGEKRLRECGFERPGYVLAGWNTMPDGSGKNFGDCETIYNLSTVQNDEIVLYAQWKRPDSSLQIDPAGGSYEGNIGITTITRGHGEMYEIDRKNIACPAGFRVSFDAGEQCIVPMRQSEMCFEEFEMSSPFYGKLEGDIYSFISIVPIVDKVTIRYQSKAIILPEANREGYSFEGWYYEPQCMSKVGNSGDSFTPSGDIILYGKWKEKVGISADLNRILEPHDPIFSCGESGYVDLKTWGRIERLEVKFPEEFLEYNPGMNRVYEYELPEQQKNEKVRFMVPLETEQNKQYEVIVYAYKDGAQTEDSPVILPFYVRGSILDELRTRLR